MPLQNDDLVTAQRQRPRYGQSDDAGANDENLNRVGNAIKKPALFTLARGYLITSTTGGPLRSS